MIVEIQECDLIVYVFFCKQKTAYEIRARDWSSDVCSSDLLRLYGEKRQYVKELTNPVSLREGAFGGLNAGNSPEKNLIFTFMQTYYQGERAMPPVDKNVASPV